MPIEFWEWYELQGFEWTSRELWDRKDKKIILLGIMIKFLLEKNIALNTPRAFVSFDDFYTWIDTGVSWNCGA